MKVGDLRDVIEVGDVPVGFEVEVQIEFKVPLEPRMYPTGLFMPGMVHDTYITCTARMAIAEDGKLKIIAWQEDEDG